MIIKTINITLGILVAVTVWSAAVTFAVFVAIMVLHVMTLGGFTVHHLLNF